MQSIEGGACGVCGSTQCSGGEVRDQTRRASRGQSRTPCPLSGYKVCFSTFTILSVEVWKHLEHLRSKAAWSGLSFIYGICISLIFPAWTTDDSDYGKGWEASCLLLTRDTDRASKFLEMLSVQHADNDGQSLCSTRESR